MARSFVAQLALPNVSTKHLVFKSPPPTIKKKEKKERKNSSMLVYGGGRGGEPNVNSVSFYLVWNSCT